MICLDKIWIQMYLYNIMFYRSLDINLLFTFLGNLKTAHRQRRGQEKERGVGEGRGGGGGGGVGGGGGGDRGLGKILEGGNDCGCSDSCTL